MSTPLPFFFFAFANDKNNPLGQLPKEASEIHGLFSKIDDRCTCSMPPQFTPEVLYQTILSKRDSLAIFHFGGHSNPTQIAANDENYNAVFYGKAGVVGLLQDLPNLVLVFINGCESGQIVDDLYEAGVPVVIGTTRKIADEIAYQLSVAFYKAIAERHTIQSAWEKATAHIAGQHLEIKKTERGFIFSNREKADANPVAPWFIRMQAGEKGGDWKIPDPPIDTKPKQLNRISKIMPPKVIGREKDLKEVRRLLTANNTLVIVNGLGGIGKTVLSHYYWQQYQAEYKHLIWLSGEGDLESALLFDSLLHQNLGIAATIAPYLDAMKANNNAEILNLESNKASNNADARQNALNYIYQSLAALDEPCLLIIDNVDEKHRWTIKDWASNLPNFHILISSRHEIADIYVHFLDGVSPSDALSLFYLYYDLEEKRQRNDEIVAKICKAAGYHTLTIELLAKTLRNRHDLTFEKLLADLDEHIVYLKKKYA